MDTHQHTQQGPENGGQSTCGESGAAGKHACAHDNHDHPDAGRQKSGCCGRCAKDGKAPHDAHTERSSHQHPEPHEEIIRDLTSTLQHVQADFENYRKRVDRDAREFRELAARSLIEDLLPVLDSFELSLKYAHTPEEFHKGVELIFGQLMSVLEHNGVEHITDTSSFDPSRHEPLMAEESEKPEGTILDVLQQGYMLGGKVIRPAKVKIAKASPKTN